MILLQLFWNFLVIGAVSFGGGYGMISLVRETVLGHGWLTESEFLSFIAVSESTPGPLAVNMATFIGASQAGLAGSFVATVGVVLPSFVIILLIAAALHSLMKYAGVNAFLAGVRPCVVAMILATACTMGLSTLGGFTTLVGGFAPDMRALAVFALLGILHFAYKKKKQKAPSPIGMILLSAVLGAVLFVGGSHLMNSLYVNDIYMQISLVMLIGLAAKNAILVVEYADRLFREQGVSLMDAAIGAAKLRVRPIIMTAFAFILGVMPLVFASGVYATARNIMGVALVGGMLFATLLGIFVYPALYYFVGKIGRFEQRRELKKQEENA